MDNLGKVKLVYSTHEVPDLKVSGPILELIVALDAGNAGELPARHQTLASGSSEVVAEKVLDKKCYFRAN